jgi:predicted O-linked N-acetylglucosamine transferase (SPINDLY family)
LLKFNHSVESYEHAYRLGERTALARLLTAKGWVDSWENIELIAAEVEKDAYACMQPNQSSCLIESAFGLEYTDIPIPICRHIHSLAPVTHNSLYIIHPDTRAQISLFGKYSRRRLRVGVISSDFGVHPVSSLIRGVLDMIDKSRIELFCFSVTDAVSWWRYNLSQSVEHFDVLQGVNSQDGASIIASKRIDILIDLNGHTKNSGLAYLSHRPAPLQMSFLGLPSTTSAGYIDYYLGDYVALPPEYRDHFSEKLILMQPCYIANDYAQLQGDVVRRFSRGNRAKRKALSTNINVSTATFLFGTISNSQKMDVTIFQVWMNVLRRYSGSVLSWTQHTGMAAAMTNLWKYGDYYGIPSHRLVMADQAPWLDHLYRKTSVDVFLDTAVKNGHTTGLDSIWSGVPTITLGGGSSMPTRAGESIASALGNEISVTYSLKEYEDLLYRFAESSSGYDDDLLHEFYLLSTQRMRVDPLYPAGKISSGYRLLRAWKHTLQDLRTTSPLFDTKTWTMEFTRLMEASWEASNIAARRSSGQRRTTEIEQKHFFSGVSIGRKSSSIDNERQLLDEEDVAEVANSYPLYHVFSISRLPTDGEGRNISLFQGYDPGSEVFHGPSAIEASDESLAVIDPTAGSGYGDLTRPKDSSSKPVSIDVNKEPISSSSQQLIFLNIGGIAKVDGWLNINTEVRSPPTHVFLLKSTSPSGSRCSHSLELALTLTIFAH